MSLPRSRWSSPPTASVVAIVAPIRYRSEMALYDQIGRGYAATRQPDARIASRIVAALGDAKSVVNVGAGAGSYEPSDRVVVAVEPSLAMIRQRAAGGAQAICGSAELLPLRDHSVDAALAVLTLHHWSDQAAGLAQLRRIARQRVVILTWDQPVCESFWLVREYFPCFIEMDRARAIPIDTLVATLGRGRVEPLLIPHDCVDGFLGAFWRRPDAYLDPAVQAGISTFALAPRGQCDDGLRRLAADLASGAWERRHANLLERTELDIGYRLVIADILKG